MWLYYKLAHNTGLLKGMKGEYYIYLIYIEQFWKLITLQCLLFIHWPMCVVKNIQKQCSNLFIMFCDLQCNKVQFPSLKIPNANIGLLLLMYHLLSFIWFTFVSCDQIYFISLSCVYLHIHLNVLLMRRGRLTH